MQGMPPGTQGRSLDGDRALSRIGVWDDAGVCSFDVTTRRLRHRRAFAVLVVALGLMHVFPPRAGPEPVVFGVLPFDLAVALAWMLAAGLAVLWMTSRPLWPDEDGER